MIEVTVFLPLIFAIIGGIVGWLISPTFSQGAPPEMVGLVRFAVSLVGATISGVIGLIITFLISRKATEADKDKYRI